MAKMEAVLHSKRRTIAHIVLAGLLVASLIVAIGLFSTGLSLDSSSRATPSPRVNEGSGQMTSVDVLIAQLEEIRRSDDRLLQTVNWSLGAFVTVVLVLLAFNWYSNSRLSDRERDQLLKEIDQSRQIRDSLDELDRREVAHNTRFAELQAHYRQEQFNTLKIMYEVQLQQGNATAALKTAMRITELGTIGEIDDALFEGLIAIEIQLRTIGNWMDQETERLVRASVSVVPDRYFSFRQTIERHLEVNAAQRERSYQWEQ